MPQSQYKLIAQNRKAYHNYEISNNIEAGIVLLGCEVKSIRLGNISIKEGYIEEEAKAKNDYELYLSNIHIGDYKFSRKDEKFNNVRKRKLLLHKKQIVKMVSLIRQKGFTAVPLKVYINNKGKIKVEIALAKGKTNYDKRQSIKEKEDKREQEKAMKTYRFNQEQ